MWASSPAATRPLSTDFTPIEQQMHPTTTQPRRLQNLLCCTALLVAGFLAGSASAGQPVAPATTTVAVSNVGNDRDTHGCVPSAGYSWCTSLDRCVRLWETPCKDSTQADIAGEDTAEGEGKVKGEGKEKGEGNEKGEGEGEGKEKGEGNEKGESEGEEEGGEQEEEENEPPPEVQILAVCLVMIFTLALLWAFELCVEAAREKLPEALHPVIGRMLAELAGVGTIGLLQKLLLAFFGNSVESMSVLCFGEADALVEVFEFLHTRIFEVAVVFFLVASNLLGAYIKQKHMLTTAIIAADTDHDGKVTPQEFVAAFGEDSLNQKEPGVFAQLLSLASGSGGQLAIVDEYMFRRRFKLSQKLPKQWGFEATGEYMEAYASYVLEEIVEFSPWTWLPLVPVVALLEQIKIAHGVLGEDVDGKVVGFMFLSPLSVCTLLIGVVGMAWGYYNFAVLLAAKQMVKPKPTTNKSGLMEIDQPALFEEDELGMKRLEVHLEEHKGLLAVTKVIAGVMRMGDEVHDNDTHRLFGPLGSHAPHLFLQLIKLHTWLLVSSVVFTFQICLRAAFMLGTRGFFAAPAGTVQEVLLYGFATLNFGFMLFFKAPATTKIYSQVTTVEGFMQKQFVDKICLDHGWIVPAK